MPGAVLGIYAVCWAQPALSRRRVRVELNCGACSSPLECGVVQPFRCDLPRVCTPEGVCWEHPLPQGNTLRSGWSAGGRRAWLAGENGTIWSGPGTDRVQQRNPPCLAARCCRFTQPHPRRPSPRALEGCCWPGTASLGARSRCSSTEGTSTRCPAWVTGAVAAGPNGIVAWRNASGPSAPGGFSTQLSLSPPPTSPPSPSTKAASSSPLWQQHCLPRHQRHQRLDGASSPFGRRRRFRARHSPSRCRTTSRTVAWLAHRSPLRFGLGVAHRLAWARQQSASRSSRTLWAAGPNGVCGW